MGQKILLLSVISALLASSPAMAALSENCSDVQNTLRSCLKYAVGEEDTPLPGCCPAARKQSEFCLCDLVRVVFYGEYLGPFKLDYNRTVNLSKICQIPGSDITYCPIVLGLTRDSPDNAAFNGTAPRNGGLTLQPRDSLGVASLLLSAVILSFFSF